MSRFVACVLLLFAWPALGHGDASWIMRDDLTRWCCGPQDCFELKSVTQTKVGWEFESPIRPGQVVMVPYTFIKRYPSINQHYWVCFDLSSGAVRCFFTSPDGV